MGSGITSQKLTPQKESTEHRVSSPFPDENPNRSKRAILQIQGNSPSGFFLIITIVAGIVMAEVTAMVVIYFFRFLPYYLQVIMDAAIMTVIIFPLLYYLIFRPLLFHIQKHSQTENISQARLRLIQFADTHAWNEVMRFTLDEIESLTSSAIGFFHFLETDRKTLSLQAWSTNTLQNMCKAEGRGIHYDLDQAGVWADCARLRKPVCINNYDSLEYRKGTPDGHAPIIRLISVPIMRDEQVVAILGVGNKEVNYSNTDAEIVSTFADFAWDIINRKRTEGALFESEEKFRTLVDWTYDWEQWVDPEGNLVYISPSCERFSGYSPEEFISDPAKLISIVHPDDYDNFQEHRKLVHDQTADTSNIEYRIIARDGTERWIDHICRPLYGKDGTYLGRRVSNRDITVRKSTEKEIFERIRKETILTEAISSMQLDIARDLHDTIGQNISYLRMRLAHLSESDLQTTPQMDAEIINMLKVTDESHDLIRGTLAVLQSGGLADPFPLFVQYAGRVEERSSFKINLSSQGEPRPLSPGKVRQLFFVFREALSNIEKHAGANVVIVDLKWSEDNLILRVADDGKGFHREDIHQIDHYGLKFMRERIESVNGVFSIKPADGNGTEVMITLPLSNTILQKN